MNVLVLGDIYGRPGRKIVSQFLPDLVKQYKPVLVVANGENAAGGFGLTRNVAEELFALGIDVLTSGNHIWDQKKCTTISAKNRAFCVPPIIRRRYQALLCICTAVRMR